MNRCDTGKPDQPGRKLTQSDVERLLPEDLQWINDTLPFLTDVAFRLEEMGLITLYNDAFSVSTRLDAILVRALSNSQQRRA